MHAPLQGVAAAGFRDTCQTNNRPLALLLRDRPPVHGEILDLELILVHCAFIWSRTT